MSKDLEYYIDKVMESWSLEDNTEFGTTDDIIEWITSLNRSTHVKIAPTQIDSDSFWFYDDYNGEILNTKRSFFSIKGIRYFSNSDLIKEQPIINQPEIGYLGILCKEIKGILYFLMQAKIEPGNANCVQISPTIQATKSNFTRAHGGKLPAYFNLFENRSDFFVLYDQIQSEQGERFYKKRNRNIILITEDNVDVLPNFRWMTLGQIKRLMKIDNLVNMDTRTVLSGIPFSIPKMNETKLNSIARFFEDKSLYRSIFFGNEEKVLKLISKINDFRMFKNIDCRFVPLNQLLDWKVDNTGITCKKGFDFSVGFFDIEIAGREVRKWTQPLFIASGSATFVLVTRVRNGTREFLVKIEPEIGCFDVAEVGPTIHWESSRLIGEDNSIDAFIRNNLDSLPKLVDVILSEEGGRFFHEQNRNIILEINSDLPEISSDYIWVDYSCLNRLIQSNNYVNIQLRNLLSLLNL